MTEWGRYGSECGPVQFGKRGKIMRVCRVSMANRFALRTLCLPALILLVSGAGEGWGQSGGEIDRLDLMPGGIARQVNALGPRVRTSDQVHMVLQGEFSAAGERRAAQVRRELSGNIRLDGFKPGGASLSFDGERSYRASSPTDYALLETFGQDMAEGMFVSLMRGGAAQLLGLRFGPDRKTNPTYTGPLFDVYAVMDSVPTRPGSVTRQKRYYFDSDTGLLHSTRYTDDTAGNIRVQTVFSNWQVLSGSAYPGRIDRYEGGKLRFSFVVTSVSNGPRQDRSVFR